MKMKKMTILQKLMNKLTESRGDRSGREFISNTEFWKSQRPPDDAELLDSYRNISYACAGINASSVANVNIRLYATTSKDQKSPRFAHHAPSVKTLQFLRGANRIAKNLKIDEITEHPILDLLHNVNEFHTQFELMELTSKYLDIIGVAFWRFESDALGTPQKLWLLPSQQVKLVTANVGGKTVITGFKYTVNSQSVTYPPSEIIFFRAPSIRDPYFAGYSPLLASMENVRLLERDVSLAAAIMENRGRPDIVISPRDPGEVINAGAAKRMQKAFSWLFGRGKSGGIYVSRTGITVDKTAFTSRDMEGVPRNQVSKISVANNYDVPIALLEAENINRATLEAAMVQHARYGVVPRITRLLQRLNKDLVPLYDSRLFLWFDNPIPEDETQNAAIREKNVKMGLRTINEERERIEENPTEWGDTPWAWGKFGILDEEMIQAAADAQNTRMTQNNNPGGVGGAGKPNTSGTNANNEGRDAKMTYGIGRLFQ